MNGEIFSYILSMKTAISVPDELFAQAEVEAGKQGISRSELYQVALRKYLKELDDGEITESYNRIATKFDTRMDPVLAEMQRRSLPVEEW